MGRKIQDEFTHLAGTVSRQRLYRLRRQREKRCLTCGEIAVTRFCLVHAVAVREYQRQYHNWKARHKSITYRLTEANDEHL